MEEAVEATTEAEQVEVKRWVPSEAREMQLQAGRCRAEAEPLLGWLMASLDL